MKAPLGSLALILLLAGSALFLNSCKEDPVPPTVTTVGVSSITPTTALSGGNVTDDGGAEVTARGVCCNTSENPTVSNSKTSDGTGTGNFTSNLAQLTPGTRYYLRAYATNSAGTAYGNQQSFTTDEVLLATLTTTAVTSITGSTAISGGNISDDGGSEITARGVCWSTSPNPTIADNITSDNTGDDSFISNLSGLTPDTTYYVRAYATNYVGTAYGNNMVFSAIPPGQVSDIDGNTYNTITIGTRVWMAENLKTTSYDNGDEIGTTSYPQFNVATETTPKYQWASDGNDDNVDIYGRLYTWWAATDERNICPTDWHVPTDEEWKQLESALGMIEDELDVQHVFRGTDEGGKLKSTGTIYWKSPNKAATNVSGFSALPGGRKNNPPGDFSLLKSEAWFWCSSENSEDNPPTGFFRALNFDEGGIVRCSQAKCHGFSIRCVKD